MYVTQRRDDFSKKLFKFQQMQNQQNCFCIKETAWFAKTDQIENKT